MRKLYYSIIEFISITCPQIRSMCNRATFFLVKILKRILSRLLMFGAALAILLYCGIGLLISAGPSFGISEANKFFAWLSIFAVAVYIIFTLFAPMQKQQNNLGKKRKILIMLFIVSYALLYCIIDQILGYGEFFSAMGNACTIVGLMVVFVEIFADECALIRNKNKNITPNTEK